MKVIPKYMQLNNPCCFITINTNIIFVGGTYFQLGYIDSDYTLVIFDAARKQYNTLIHPPWYPPPPLHRLPINYSWPPFLSILQARTSFSAAAVSGQHRKRVVPH